MAFTQTKPFSQQGRTSRNPFWLSGHPGGPQQYPIGPIRAACHHVDAVVDAVAHIDIKPPWLTKQGFVAGRAAPMPVAGGLLLGIRLRFHNHGSQ